MEIHNGMISFKSTTDNYWKELIGIKNNTMRTIPQDEVDKYDLIVHPGGYATYKTPSDGHRKLITTIHVEHVGATPEDASSCILRELTDVTEYGNRVLFSWR